MWRACRIAGSNASQRSLQKQRDIGCARQAEDVVKGSFKTPNGSCECDVHGSIPHKPGNGFVLALERIFLGISSHANTLGKACGSLSLARSQARTFARITDVSPKRGLATQGDVENQDEQDFDSESGDLLSDTEFLDGFSSDEEVTDDNLGTEKHRVNSSAPHTRPDQDEDLEVNDDEEDVYDDVRTTGTAKAGDDLLTGSLLDLATDDAARDPTGQTRPLWLRLEKAAIRKPYSCESVIKTWAAEGNAISRGAIIFTLTVLRRRMKYRRALEISDWVMTKKPFELSEMDYATRVELIARVHGIQKAEGYFASIPKEFQTAMAYSILLEMYAEQNMLTKAVQLMEKVRKVGLDQTTFMYNQLLFLYKKRGEMNKVAETLHTMDEKNVEPDVYTYNILLDIRSRKGDVDGMEKVWRRLEDDKNVKPDAATYCILAKGYISAGLTDKAEKATEQVETSSFRRKRLVHQMLLKLYAQLGKADELERIWKLVTRNPKILMDDYIIMIEALGKVGEADRAEEIFKQMIIKLGTKRLQQYNALLSVYSNLGMVRKAEDLLKQMLEQSFSPSPATYHYLIQMYVKAGKGQKAMDNLSKAQRGNRGSYQYRPWYASFQLVLDMFAEQGDVKNAEKVIRDLKNAGYICAYRSYSTLLKAYSQAGVAPYGFLDRIRADGVIPNANIRSQLKQLDGT